MTRAIWDHLLSEVRKAHTSHPGLSAFCPFPEDVREVEVLPNHIPPSDLLQAETRLAARRYFKVRDAFIAASPLARWRETYRGTDIGQDFLDRFACYCLIGAGGAFASNLMSGFVVYMPPGLWYPWHHHPAEEAYLVLAGEARFFREGQPMEVFGEGDVSVHASNQPHAMKTEDQAVMAYVVWRNGFGTPPVLTKT